MSLALSSRLRSSGPLAAALIVALFAPAAVEGGEPIAAAEDHAIELAEQTLAAMGGQQAWEQTRFLRFTFAGARTHWWDRATGRHRLEGTTREDGKHYVVLHDLEDRIGEVYLDGEKLVGRDAEEWLDRAHAAWINDTYWLLMPYKLRDPGVHLLYEGRREFDGKEVDTLLLTFDGVGLTPGDRYRVYLDPETRLVCGWAYELESFEPDQAPTEWRWGDWQRYGEILLASRRTMLGSDRELPLTDIAVYQHLPDAVFEDLAPVVGH